MNEIETRFEAQHARGAFSAGQLVVHRGQQCLVDLALGAESDTRFQVMSASKGVLARAIAILHERRQIDLAACVRAYIPDFSASDVTVIDVLTHRSGVTLPVLSRTPEAWHDWNNVLAALRDEPPTFRRGTLAYQPIAFGWILTELLQRITGETLEDFSRREFGSDLAWRYDGEAAKTRWLGAERYTLNGANLAERFESVNNTISARTALVPGAGMYTTARALARFYASLLDHESDAERPHTRGLDKITGAYVVLGRGFCLGWLLPHPYGWWNTRRCFGHPGGFSVVAYADREADVGVAIVTDGNRSVGDLVRRFAPLGSAIRRFAIASKDGMDRMQKDPEHERLPFAKPGSVSRTNGAEETTAVEQSKGSADACQSRSSKR